MTPSISIVMPVWNGEKYIAQAIDSLLSQTFADFELIVVDDGSTDGTVDILRSYKDPRLRVLRLDHGGIVMALNYGVAKSQADWIARLDADDLSEPTRLQAQWDAVQADPRATLCFTGIQLIGDVPAGYRQARLPRSRSLTALRLCFQCPIYHSTVLFKKDAFLAAGGYRPEERHAEDFAAWGRLMENGEIISIPAPLVQFRLHQESVSKKHSESQIALTRRIATDHCQRFLQLSPKDASRAYDVLTTADRERTWKDWSWFLIHCAPRLRWRSFETVTWLALQTLKLVFQR